MTLQLCYCGISDDNDPHREILCMVEELLSSGVVFTVVRMRDVFWCINTVWL
jgi:hypothetical protein